MTTFSAATDTDTDTDTAPSSSIDNFLDTSDTFDLFDLFESSPEMATPSGLYRRPEPFDSSGNIKEWLQLMRFFIQGQKPTASQEEIATAVITNLGGAARTWALSQLNNGSLTTTPEVFLENLVAEFTPYADERQAEADLEKLKQNGSVSEYIAIFQTLIVRISNLGDQEKRRAFLRGLKPTIRKAVDRANVNSYDDARKAALVEDTDYNRGSGALPQVQNRTSTNIPATNPDAMDIDAFRGPSLKRLTPQEREQLRRKNACFRCRQIGHISRNCHLGQQHPRFQNGPAVMNTEWQQSPFTGSQAPIGYPYFYPNAPYGIYPPPMHMAPFASAPQAQTNAQPPQQYQQQQQQSSQDFPQRQ